MGGGRCNPSRLLTVKDAGVEGLEGGVGMGGGGEKVVGAVQAPGKVEDTAHICSCLHACLHLSSYLLPPAR
jgi:hypothetical protein